MDGATSFLPQFSSLFRVMKVHLRVGGGRITLAEMGGGLLGTALYILSTVGKTSQGKLKVEDKVEQQPSNHM